MPAHHLEIERKYESPDGAELTIDFSSLKGFSIQSPVTEEMDAAYMDTANRDLSSARVALRRRLGGYDEGWHIKFNGHNGGRHEVTFELLKNREKMPAAVEHILQGVTAGQPLQEVVSLKTTRIRTVVTDGAQHQILEICDDTVQAFDFTTQVERSWHEWEVELIDPGHEKADEAFSAVDAIITEAGAQESQSIAKIARAMGQDVAFEQRRGALTEAPEGTAEDDQHQWRPAQTVEYRVRSGLDHLVSDLAISDLKVRAEIDDATQQLRVSARKLAGFIELAVLPFVSDEQAEIELNEVITELSELAADTASVRELVAVRRFMAGHNDYGVISQSAENELEAMIQKDEEASHRAVRRRLDSAEYIELVLFLRSLVLHVQDHIELPREEKEFLSAVAQHGRSMLKMHLKDSKALWKAKRADFIDVPECENTLRMIALDAKSVAYALGTCRSAGLKLPKKIKRLAKLTDQLQEGLIEQRQLQEIHQWLDAATRKVGRAGSDRLAVGYLLGIAEQKRYTVAYEAHSYVPDQLQKIKDNKIK
ncbi:CYTH and CHAD domain-containing protein [Rothia terrae]|uniref:CYTH and CHAD domain-containing protein n=1 Tax=Rothia terrae TaxID=396015 RepID=UPI001447DA6A|nr:CYTH and CHAD domain-containing protein [Rothia terrae]NKZ34499.1 CYTH and CHAD domain-containing protein [Rothia terrae]